MTTYPFGTYAAGWGTSFSAPLVSGTAALLVSQATVTTPLKPAVSKQQASGCDSVVPYAADP